MHTSYFIFASIDRVHKGIKEVCELCGLALCDKNSLRKHMQGKHNGKEDENSEDEKITTIQFHPCSEFRDVSQERKAQVWVYYLFNEKTQESKCRYCGNIWNFKKGDKVIIIF